jgi:Tol biopolymer transport system component
MIVHWSQRWIRTRWTLSVLASFAVACGRDPVRPPDGTPPPPLGAPNDSPPPTERLATITGRIAFASDRTGSSWIYVADSTGVRQLAPGDEPSWSPDGVTIAYASPDGIGLMNADGTNTRLVRARGTQPAWSPDGQQIAFIDGGIRVMQADGAFERLLVSDDVFQAGDEMHRPDWSTDGQRIAFQRYDCCWMEPVEIYVVGLDGTPPRKVIDGVPYGDGRMWVSLWAPAWSPDGTSMAFVYYFSIAMIGPGEEIPRALGANAAWESDLAWSPDGRRLAFSDYDGVPTPPSPSTIGQLRLYVLDVATREVQQLIPEASSPEKPDYWDNHAVWTHARP